MEKLTKEQVVEKMNSLDVSFLNNYGPYVKKVEATEKYEQDKNTAKEEINSIANELRKFLEDNKVKFKSERGYRATGRDDYDIYYNYTCTINGKVFYERTGGNHIEYNDDVFVAECARAFFKDYKEKQYRFDCLSSTKEIVDYKYLSTELKELKSKNFFGRLASYGRMRKINKRLAEVKTMSDKYNKLGVELKQNEKTYNLISKIVEKSSELAQKIEDKVHDYKEEYEREYSNALTLKTKNEQVKQSIIDMQNKAKKFLLTEFYRKHEAEFKDSREPLISIYAKNSDLVVKKEFKDMLMAYDHALVISKNEGKDFDSLKPEEKFDYFETAQKVIETAKDYGTFQSKDNK